MSAASPPSASRVLSKGISVLSGFRLGSVAECFASLFHLPFKRLACRLPGFFLERHFATAQTLARVLSGILAATALAFARILSFAGVFLRDGAIAHAGAGIVCPFPLGFASVQAATDVLVLEKQFGIVFSSFVRGSSNHR